MRGETWVWRRVIREKRVSTRVGRRRVIREIPVIIKVRREGARERMNNGMGNGCGDGLGIIKGWL